MKKKASVKIEFVDINEIRPNPANPRKISESKIKELMNSIESLPEMLESRYIVVERETGYILGGNQRWVACKRLGHEQVPVVYADTMTEEERKEFLIRDNTEYGEWDQDKLEQDFADFPLYEWGVTKLTPRAEERAEDSADLEKMKRAYDTASVKQIVCFFDKEKYLEVVEKINKIKEENFFGDNAEVLIYLTNKFATNE